MSVSARKSDNGLFQRMKIALGWRRCKGYLPKFVAARKGAMMGIYGLIGLLFADQLIWTRIEIDLGWKFLFINLTMSCLLDWDRARSMWLCNMSMTNVDSILLSPYSVAFIRTFD